MSALYSTPQNRHTALKSARHRACIAFEAARADGAVVLDTKVEITIAKERVFVLFQGLAYLG